MLWEHIISNDFPAAVKAANGVCVVPVGCLEKHGPHSPLGTDTIIARETVCRAAELEPVVVFPTMFFGEKTGAGEYPGTVIFSLETRWMIFKETCNEIYRNGFKKIFFVNQHGGNKSMLDVFTRAMMKENPNIMIFNRHTWSMGHKQLLADIIADRETYPYITDEDRAAMQDFIDQNKVTGHACFAETAAAYYFNPETVRLDRINAESGDSVHRFDAFKKYGITTPLGWMADYPNSYHGSNEYVLNERIAKAFTEFRIRDLASAFAFLKNENVSDTYHAQWLEKQHNLEF